VKKKIRKIRFLYDPTMKLSICDAKIMNSFCEFFQNFKNILNDLEMKIFSEVGL
jgi:hypothetical protein